MKTYKTEIETREIKIVDSITCDICKKTFSLTNPTKDFNFENEVEIQEFHHIDFYGGYGSVFGDSNRVQCDICQRCLNEKLGKYFRFNEDSQDTESSKENEDVQV